MVTFALTVGIKNLKNSYVLYFSRRQRQGVEGGGDKAVTAVHK